jgi:phosphate transport system permease protein
MTVTTSTLTAPGLRSGTLHRRSFAAVAGGAVLLAALLFAVTPMQGVADFIVFTTVLVIASIGAASWIVEGRRRAKDRVATSAAIVCLLLTLLPLGFVIGYTIKRGLSRLSPAFLTHSMAGVGPLSPGGGIYHAILGTLEQVLLASLIAVPLGLLVAIYITEFGKGAFATAIRFLIDVMTGIPSIVAGLFVLSFWVLTMGQGFSGFAGALALAILELPIIVRSTEEMIKLVPGSLREASYALGVPKWKTVLHIVLPTAATGITTGVMLAISRVVGETAPVLLVVGNNDFIHTNPFTGAQSSLPLYVFQGAGSASKFDVSRAWAAALTLIVIVVVLYIAARLVTRRGKLTAR